jgi:ankyrin repeat protein
MKVSFKGNTAKMKRLIGRGADVNAVAFRDQPRGGSPVLRYAIDSHNPAAVELLLSQGADPNNFTSHAPLHTSSHNVRNLSLLSYAIRTKAQLSIIQALINHGANIDGEPKIAGDFTALMVAAIVGYTQAVKLLLNLGANKDAINTYDKKTALDYARENNHPAIVQLLKS